MLKDLLLVFFVFVGLSSGHTFAQPANNLYYANQYCTTPNVYDQSCIANAISVAGNNSHIVLGPFTYNLSSEIVVSNLSNVILDGAGAILKKDGEAFQCNSCNGVRVSGINFQTVTTPTVVNRSSLPTPSTSTIVVIDRWNSGNGYIPNAANDKDIVPPTSGGNCTSQCLSDIQSAEVFDTGVFFNGGSGLDISGLSGSWFYIKLYDINNSIIHGNQVMGGKNFWGGIFCWKSDGSSGKGCHYNLFTENIVSYTSFSGIAVGGGDHNIISNNSVRYGGESGIKVGQNGNQITTYSTIVGNSVKQMHFDCYDISGTYPHTATVQMNTVLVGNVADGCDSTAYYMDGKNISVSGNIAANAGGTGFSSDLANSSLVGNISFNNNSLQNLSGSHQIAIGVSVASNNMAISANYADTNGNPGYPAYFASGPNIVSANWANNGPFFDAYNPPPGTFGNALRGNFSNGSLLQDSPYETGSCFLSGGTYCLNTAGGPGFYTASLPASNGTLAMQSSFSGTKTVGSCTFTVVSGIITNITGC